ncbi:MAG: phosphate signaling complex protein PhoU [Rubinisphaera brasiliensis]|uniref:Phosphate-specific transport system accessory protein PhoU n=1 Tax=Rubinisphaera brasiliensis (strain ATCC 49424 / DSM 5305 / JCM 21570 / IAM 15109 / NBRC 103401 / IFAM 1448) TaxID=756272 RepID=F0SNU5_RUBBR|nr:phosphate signaling complex protein PhoU [Rubinisphaera brasiliensis]ADY60021.1 phosphate uptake regulator, PhoU [Rubinisphaera brasiliensis DSM 5305]MBR9802729.1 phosphate signaling complex protein PhoU [bacterium]
MSVHLIRDLDNLHRSLMSMCTMVEELIHSAVATLSTPDLEKARELAARDLEIDDYDVTIEEECLKILALHQPVATDLRRITAVMKISGELERVADLAVHIAERSSDLSSLGEMQIPSRVHDMAENAVNMLHESIDAYVNLDTSLARKVCQQDEVVDALNRQIIENITRIMARSPHLISPALHLFSASRHIERVADHATNIAEDVIYLVEGEIVRHRGQSDRKVAS